VEKLKLKKTVFFISGAEALPLQTELFRWLGARVVT